MNDVFKDLPLDWGKTRLRFCVDGLKNGIWGGEKGTDERNIVCIRVSDFNFDSLTINHDNLTIRSITNHQCNNLILKNGDILIEKSGGGEKTPVGRIVRFNLDIDAVTSNFIARIRPNKRIVSQYLAYLLASLYYLKYSHQFIKQNTGIQNLDDSALFSSSVFIPNYKTQMQIVDFLDKEIEKINELIFIKEKFLSLIQEKNQSLANSVVNGSILSSSGAGNEGWFGILPKNWETRRAKFLFREAQGKSEAGEEELLTVSHITGVTRRADKNVNMFMAESMDGYKLVSKSDIVINTMWAWMGAMGVSPYDGLISPSYNIYKPIANHYEDGYLDLVLRSKSFIAEATRRSKGIHSSRLRLYPDAFLDILFPIPDKITQKNILDKFKNDTGKEKKISELSKKSIEKLKEFRTSIMTSAITGQLDIKKWRSQGRIDYCLDRIANQNKNKKVGA